MTKVLYYKSKQRIVLTKVNKDDDQSIVLQK